MNEGIDQLGLNTLDLDKYNMSTGSLMIDNPVKDTRSANDFFILHCEVKWFKMSEGYGFVRIADNVDLTWLTENDDIFIHASKCDIDKIGNIKAGDTMRCKVVHGVRGPQVDEIYEYTSIVVEERAVSYINGFIKWFDQQKGFGFVVSSDNDQGQPNHGTQMRDVFLAGARVRQLGIDYTELRTNTRVAFTYKVDVKGQLLVDQLKVVE